jgi:hypothetical protein
MESIKFKPARRLATISARHLPKDELVATLGSGAVQIYMKDCDFEAEEGENFSGKWVVVVRTSETSTRYQQIMDMQLREVFPGMYAITMVQTDSRFGGFNLAPKVYSKLVKSGGINLMTDKLQSPGGQYIWSQLLESKGVQVAGYNCSMTRRPQVLHEVYKNETVNRLEVEGYNAWVDSDSNNWGFVATKSRETKRRSL